jgi:hypothetical protein
MVKKEYIQHEMTVQLLNINTFLVKSLSFTLKTMFNLRKKKRNGKKKKKLYVMDKSGYDFLIQCVETDKRHKILQTTKPL